MHKQIRKLGAISTSRDLSINPSPVRHIIFFDEPCHINNNKLLLDFAFLCLQLRSFDIKSAKRINRWDKLCYDAMEQLFQHSYSVKPQDASYLIIIIAIHKGPNNRVHKQY